MRNDLHELEQQVEKLGLYQLQQRFRLRCQLVLASLVYYLKL
mgnify:CR=1 FL=1